MCEMLRSKWGLPVQLHTNDYSRCDASCGCAIDGRIRLLPSTGYTICMQAMSDYVVEYPCILSDNATALGNYVGPRMGTSGYYINSTEGGRSVALPRPAAGTWMRFAAAVANDASGGVGLDGAAGAGAARAAVDFKARRYLKFATASSAAGGLWRIARLALYPQVLTNAQLQRLTA